MQLSKEESTGGHVRHIQSPPMALWPHGDVHPEAPLDFKQGKQRNKQNRTLQQRHQRHVIYLCYKM